MGAWQEIVDFTVPSNTTSVTLNNFGTITKDDFIMYSITVNGSVGRIRLYPNGNTNNSNYFVVGVQATGTTLDTFRLNESFIGFSSSNSFSKGYMKIASLGHVVTWGRSDFQNLNQNVLYTDRYNTSTFTVNDITSFVFSTQSQMQSGSRIQIFRLAAEKIADINITSNTTQVDITGLNIKKGDEYLLLSDVINPASGSPSLNLTPNDLTSTSQYFSQRIAVAAVSLALTATRDSNSEIMNITGNDLGFSSKSIAYTHFKVTNTGSFTGQSYNVFSYGNGLIATNNRNFSSTYENLSTVTKLNLISSGTNAIGTNTRFELYKLYEGGN